MSLTPDPPKVGMSQFVAVLDNRPSDKMKPARQTMRIGRTPPTKPPERCPFDDLELRLLLRPALQPWPTTWPTQILGILFHSGVYGCYAVPRHTFDGLLAARSKGSYLHTHIAGHFSYSRVG
jgi:hypothetical protein